MKSLRSLAFASLALGSLGLPPAAPVSSRAGTPSDLLNLDRAVLGSGTLDGWELRPVKGAPAPRIEIREAGGARVLRVSGAGAAGWFHRRLSPRIKERSGTLRWSWRVLRAPAGADLRKRDRDDAPLRVFVVFGHPRSLFGGGGRIIFYTWGNGEPEGLTQPSFVSGRMQIARLAGTSNVGPRWRQEAVRPFDDYRRFWNRKPPPITAVGIMQDTDMTHAMAVAELRELSWNESGELVPAAIQRRRNRAAGSPRGPVGRPSLTGRHHESGCIAAASSDPRWSAHLVGAR